MITASSERANTTCVLVTGVQVKDVVLSTTLLNDHHGERSSHTDLHDILSQICSWDKSA